MTIAYSKKNKKKKKSLMNFNFMVTVKVAIWEGECDHVRELEFFELKPN